MFCMSMPTRSCYSLGKLALHRFKNAENLFYSCFAGICVHDIFAFSSPKMKKKNYARCGEAKYASSFKSFQYMKNNSKCLMKHVN